MLDAFPAYDDRDLKDTQVGGDRFALILSRQILSRQISMADQPATSLSHCFSNQSTERRGHHMARRCLANPTEVHGNAEALWQLLRGAHSHVAQV